MTQWIDRPGPDDDPVVRVEDDLTADPGTADDAERRPGGVADVHGDVKRDRYLQGEETEVDDDVAQGLTGDVVGSEDDTAPQQRADGEPAKKHGDPLVHPEDDPPPGQLR